jgi:hypothetical protein
MSDERWYEFEQRETFTRPIYVKAASLREARQALDDGAGVADYPPTFPDMVIGGRGRIARDQEHVDNLAEERALDGGRDA